MDRGFLPVADILKLSTLTDGPGIGDVLCSIDDIENGEAKELSFRSRNELYDIFIQKHDGNIYAYVNVCPHAGTPLNMEEGRFMEKSGKYLMCHTHGALFQLDDGLCVAGPCNGARLQAVAIKVEKSLILVA